MKTLYIQCNMGAAGDMLSAALFELIDDKDEFLKKLNNVGIPGIEVKTETTQKCGITGTRFHVYVNGCEEGHEHEHHHEHEHEHEHEHSHEHEHEHEHEIEHSHEHEHHHEHEHSHEHEHEYEHHHEHEHEHEHSHEHHHEHEHSHEHHHAGIHDIEHIVRGHLELSDKVKDDIMSVFNNIARAESEVHQKDMDHIHFHEVGTMDAVADITAVCMLMDTIKPDRIIVSPIHVGSGNVKCAHGILPVPAPATALILKGIPFYSGDVKGELCTPTGAAILKYFADSFGEMPVMSVEKIGYGMGGRDFEQANCVRAFLGESQGSTDSIYEISCNIDDMTAEEIAYAQEAVYKAGAVEVFTVAAGAKKCRQAVVFTALCREEEKEEAVKAIFKHTTTIGIRFCKKDRYVLDRSFKTIDTPYGSVIKKECSGYGVTKSKFEFDSIAKIADEQGRAISDIRRELEK